MAVQFCEVCKSLIVNGSCSNIQCHNPTGTVGQEKRRGWKIGTSFVDFQEPVTEKYARSVVEKLSKIHEEEFKDGK